MLLTSEPKRATTVPMSMVPLTMVMVPCTIRRMKGEQIHFRISPRYKRYLEEMAGAKGFTVGQLLKDWTRMQMWEWIGHQAHVLTAAKVLRSHGIEMEPETASKYLDELLQTSPKTVSYEYAKEWDAAFHPTHVELCKKYDYREHEAELAEVNAEGRPKVASKKRARRSVAR